MQTLQAFGRLPHPGPGCLRMRLPKAAFRGTRRPRPIGRDHRHRLRVVPGAALQDLTAFKEHLGITHSETGLSSQQGSRTASARPRAGGQAHLIALLPASVSSTPKRGARPRNLRSRASTSSPGAAPPRPAPCGLSCPACPRRCSLRGSFLFRPLVARYPSALLR